MPVSYLALAKWVGAGLLALIVSGAITYGIYTLNAWHSAAKALPGVEAARDAAIKERDAVQAAKEKQAGDFAASLDGIAGRIGALETKISTMLAERDAEHTQFARAYQTFQESTKNVALDALPGSADDQLVRRGLLDLLRNPDTGQLGREDRNGNGESGGGAELSGGASGTDDVPGRQSTGENQQGAMVPGAAGSDRHGATRAAQGRRRKGAVMGAKRARRPAPAERLVRAMSAGFVLQSRRCGKNALQQVMEAEARARGAAVFYG